MEIFGLASLFDYFGENLIFRNLNILDKNAPQFDEIKNTLGMEKLPRKNSEEYAEAVYYIVKNMCPDLESILYFGDTDLDAGVIKNLSKVTGARVSGFIYDAGKKIPEYENNLIYRSDRWENITDFINMNKDCLNSGCVGLFDLDKTVLGAKGRNSHIIDMARIDAVIERVLEIDPDIHKDFIKEIYDVINQSFKRITEDNQDITAFLTILVCFGVIDTDYLQNMLNPDIDFDYIIKDLSGGDYGKGLNDVFEEVKTLYNKGESTMFKTFRYNELKTTLAKINSKSKGTDIRKVLETEITMTKEICDLMDFLKEYDINLFCVSDKPDETVFPPEDLDNPEKQIPLYLRKAKIVGNGIYNELKEIKQESMLCI